MMRRGFLGLVVVSLLMLGGCRSAPVRNIVDAPVVSSKPATAQDVERAILGAGTSLGWQMVPQGPGRITGTIALRRHRAVVDIGYTAKSYSIQYKDSENLDYTGSSIHNNYNGWIENLDRAIRARLAG